MIKRILLLLIGHLSICSSDSPQQRLAVFCHGFNNHAGRFADRHKSYAPVDCEPVCITFKHRQVCFGVIGKNTISEALIGKESQPTSFVSFSQGTTSTLHYVGNKEDCSNIASIVLIAPIADPRDIVQNYSFMKYLYMPEWISTRVLKKGLKHYNPTAGTPIEQIAKIKNLPVNSPVIVIHGTNDTTSPWEQGYKIAEAFHNLGHQAVYFIEHDGGHNQPYDLELIRKCEEEIEKLPKNLSKKDFKSKKREIQERISDPERKEIADKITAIYLKHCLVNKSSAASSEINADDYLFEKQKNNLWKKYQARKIFLTMARIATSAALVGAVGFAAYFIRTRFF